jgi:hypothetical protein
MLNLDCYFSSPLQMLRGYTPGQSLSAIVDYQHVATCRSQEDYSREFIGV